MSVMVTYSVNEEKYNQKGAMPEMITTEYIYKNNLLVRLQLGRNINIRINNMFSSDFPKDIDFEQEHYFYNKTYSKEKPKKIDRNTFYERLKRFPQGEIRQKQEILEDHIYFDKDNKQDNVQIVITKTEEKILSIIHFKNVSQYHNFILPEWLSEYTA